ncbi:MAG TPA: hypothetical protein VIN56_06530 [Candidatus Dormibacteraeota bacterium]
MKKNLRVILPVAGIAALGLGVAAVQAAAPAPASNPAQVFVDKLAAILHLPSSTVAKDLKQAQLDTIQQMVTDGKITQAQADAMKAKVNSSTAPAPGFRFGGGFGERIEPAVAGDLRTAELNAAAKVLKIDVATLQSDLRARKTPADLEKAANVSEANVRDAVRAAAKGVLDQAVKDKKITQPQEDAVLARLQNGPALPFGRGGHGPRRGFRGPGGGPGGPGGPGTRA